MAPRTLKTPKKSSVRPISDLSIQSEKWEGWFVINLSGKFVVKFLSQVRTIFDTIEINDKPHVAIDLSQLTQIDSSALTVLLNFQKRLQEKSGNLVLIGPTAEIKETLLLVGFNMVVPIYNSRALFERSISAE